MGAYLTIFLGAGLGGMLRHAVNTVAAAGLGRSFPYGTLIVNVTGSLAIGLLAGWLAFKGAASQELRLFLTTGLLGGYTTFSAFSLDSVLLWEKGDMKGFLLYVGGSVGLSLLALVLGLVLMRPEAHI